MPGGAAGQASMGVFYNSICIPGDRRDEVRRSLERWLRGRGFELSAQPMLFDLDGEAERNAFVIWNDRWTVLAFSKYEEERRLIRELQTWASPILYLWVQDSDVWGYDLFDAAGFTGSWSSDPRSFRSFADDEAERPMADPEEVCRQLELPGRAPELRRILRRKALFKEDACRELCRLIGAEAAAVSYDDLERGTAEASAGWRSEQLLYFHRGSVAAPACSTELHEVDVGELASGAAFGAPRAEMTPELLAEVEEMRRRAELRFRLLKPVAWLAQRWRWGREQLASGAGRPDPREAPEAAPVDPAPAAAGAGGEGEGSRELDNPRHRCRITLAPGTVAAPVSGRPAAVFAFRAGETLVTCTARRRWKIAEVLRPPGRSQVLCDERYRTRSGLAARHLLFELPPLYMAGTTDPSFLGLHVVAIPIALYVFLYRFTRGIDPAVDEAIRSTVASFRLLDG